MNLLAFDPSAANIAEIRAAQEVLAETRFYPRALGIDGDFGAGSRRALAANVAACSPGAELSAIALTQLGVSEQPRGSNNGPFVNLYQDDNGGEHGESWCADFVCWCLRRLIQNASVPSGVTPAATRAAWGFTSWAETVGAKVIRPGEAAFLPRRSDIVEYTFSHCGIVHDFADGVLHSVEGNTNSDGSADGYEVCLHPRYLSNVRALIRLPFAA